MQSTMILNVPNAFDCVVSILYFAIAINGLLDSLAINLFPLVNYLLEFVHVHKKAPHWNSNVVDSAIQKQREILYIELH